ncbi:hypothetical protein [Deefgea sp. CFH1-16]|uniref:hypothetical protein n=1 Tax=Deefgea sp. CFH1-16 TaxID=2675457 RepID=UPI0015F739D8|nr:hypothetical protein [Deefgea sp. CFH1-16]MBM5575788.1 hypothetical protein [Deefgea sp. CFH1-16]
MPAITTFSVTHSMPRTRAADADAIVEAVNATTASNGDSLSRDAVETELNELLAKVAAKTGDSVDEVKAHYGLEIIATENEIDEE